MKQKGFAPILIVILIAVLVGGYLIYQNQTKPTPPSQQIIQTSPSPISNPINNISPDGSYVVAEQTIGDKQNITIKDKQGNIIVDDLVSKNSKEIGYNVKFKCQCGTSFKKWINNTIFSINIVNGGGEEYEYLVDAITGKVDGSSFKKIK